MHAIRFVIEDIGFAERDVKLRLPFRFGAATVTGCPQVYVRVRIRLENGRTETGCAAEMMIPKWFDKSPDLTQELNFIQLREALSLAREAYVSDPCSDTAWGHFARHYRAIHETAQRCGLPGLVASYGPALVDRAVFDAACHALGVSFGEAMSANAAGMRVQASGLAGDLAGFDLDAFLAAHPASYAGRQIAARHTVGLTDALIAPPQDAPTDGLPSCLAQAVARYGHRHFKLKLSGDAQSDAHRLAQIVPVIRDVMDGVTLDGNEQYRDAAHLAEFLDHLERMPALAPLANRLAFIEQPLARAQTLDTDVSALAARVPLLIDESDATVDAFPRARAMGYTGVSSKSCKGFYKSVLNAARCAAWSRDTGRAFFLSGEDLTMQAGLGIQQDLALVGWLGLAHVERNGHHYVNGLSCAPQAEQHGFLRAFPTLYAHSEGAVRLRIDGGGIDLSGLDCAGFATGVAGGHVSWDAMRSVY
ncbi:MAG: enolase C-terminal domain-like protein [Castellaniella sp.]|uniref:enolase C-terminal domain-like protein n=1 Tax=Castellaniella sp. TaxID=1955812 RepID=UPI003A89F6C7